MLRRLVEPQGSLTHIGARQVRIHRDAVDLCVAHRHLDTPIGKQECATLRVRFSRSPLLCIALGRRLSALLVCFGFLCGPLTVRCWHADVLTGTTFHNTRRGSASSRSNVMKIQQAVRTLGNGCIPSRAAPKIRDVDFREPVSADHQRASLVWRPAARRVTEIVKRAGAAWRRWPRIAHSLHHTRLLRHNPWKLCCPMLHTSTAP
jgi:hypothetical protein